MTNEERIKSLSTEELADELYDIIHCTECPISDLCTGTTACRETWKQWLKSEVEE